MFSPATMLSRSSATASRFVSTDDPDDDDFQAPPTQTLSASVKPSQPRKRNNPLRPRPRPSLPPFKKPKRLANHPGKENAALSSIPSSTPTTGSDDACSLDLIPSSIDCSFGSGPGEEADSSKVELLDLNKGPLGYLCNSIESRLIRLRPRSSEFEGEDFDQHDHKLDELLRLCNDVVVDGQEEDNRNDGVVEVQCPVCGVDISGLNEEQRSVHSNDCLPEVVDGPPLSPRQAVDASPVVKWLSNLGLARYADAFVHEEVDWDTLKWLTEEDLFNIGVTALGPRKKIVHALSELGKGCSYAAEMHVDHTNRANGSGKNNRAKAQTESSNVTGDENGKQAANKLITDFFPGLVSDRKKKVCTPPRGQHMPGKGHSDSGRGCVQKNHVKNGKLKDIPTWCCIPGTPFRVDAFRYLRGDCSHWFLTHFHMDHYQGLTRSFRHGKIYCSSITAQLVIMKLGIPCEKLQVLPLNQKINIAGVDITCLDANHCPGSIMILFEPPNGKAVLHTGDFRLSEEMAGLSVWRACPIRTLILDTTYCNPQYDFPKQEAVIQFVIEAIQAEAFNPKTLFLIGSYTIGKERLFLEVARVLRRKVYITAAKFRLLQCLGFSEEDMRWFTQNEQESQIHVVPMWTLASFKRLKHISNQYAGRFSLIVAFSPTGWTFGKGKKKSPSPGRRWQQGTIIRYEVPYSEHCSFSELQEFVKLLSPETIIPSVNNNGPDSAKAMLSLLLP